MRSIVLLSGGMDSATALWMERAPHREIITLAFDYGQRHSYELEAAAKLSHLAGAERHLTLLLPVISNTALTGDEDLAPGKPGEIPVSYVPARNTVFLAHALSCAEQFSADRIVIGVSAVDYSGYPDCRPEFIGAFKRLAHLATRDGVEGRGPNIVAPLIHLSKADTVRLGVKLDVPYQETRSCYNLSSAGISCGSCDACRLRLEGFAEAGALDTAPYRA